MILYGGNMKAFTLPMKVQQVESGERSYTAAATQVIIHRIGESVAMEMFNTIFTWVVINIHDTETSNIN